MKRFTRLLGAALLAVPMLGSVVTAEDAAKPAQPAAAKARTATKAPGLKGSYAQMANELSLSEEQKAKLLTIATEREAAVKAWNDANKAKYDELRAKATAASGGGDKQGAKTANDEAARLKKDLTAVEDKYTAQIEAILTPEQQNHWAGYNAYKIGVGSFKSVNLTEEQKTKIKDRYVQAGAQLKAASTPKDKAALSAKIREQVEAEILTDAQRTALANEREAQKKAKEAAKAAKNM